MSDKPEPKGLVFGSCREYVKVKRGEVIHPNKEAALRDTIAELERHLDSVRVLLKSANDSLAHAQFRNHAHSEQCSGCEALAAVRKKIAPIVGE